ncbi:MAG: copper chaperone PCu(A)C [Nitrosomonadales bacterium]|nr:copper chaperone PCu(A)C [Nitrosomonadales bacterium]
MGNLHRLAALVALLISTSAVFAGDIEVSGAWSRATAPGQDTGMADLTITSKQAATLVGATSPAAKSVELHSMTHDKGVMKMREVKAIELTAGNRVNLGESGYHLMLLGLKAPLKAGATVPLTLIIKTADKRVVKIDASADVKPLAAAKADAPQDEHMHHNH